MTDTVARMTIAGIRPDGQPIRIEFSVGVPYEEKPDTWRCPVSLTPLYKKLAHAAGGDAVQSLCMAISLGLYLLDKFKEDGGQLMHDDGTPFVLEPYAFGIAVKGEQVPRTPPE